MWDKLKEILKVGGGKAVIVEDGDPKYIVLPVDEYLKLTGTGGNKEAAQPAPGIGEGTPFPGGSTPSAPSAPSAPSEPVNDNESIFRGAIDPSGSEAPVDLSDIDAKETPTLADYRGSGADLDLDDLPL